MAVMDFLNRADIMVPRQGKNRSNLASSMYYSSVTID